MNFWQKIYYFFSRYTDPAERRVGKFFARVNERDSPHRLETALLRLLQRDIAVINLWTEHRYKGYNYLDKRTRRELYTNLAAIQADFDAWAASQSVDQTEVLSHIRALGVETAALRAQPEQLAHLVRIMRYLAPSAGRYEYRESSSFGRLLRDPRREKLIGDCNQIVTLYLALYASKFPLRDLQLTVYPGHVALHFQGVDIETTNGRFAHYDKPGQATQPVHEIVSINLLDTTDTNFAKSSVDPSVFLQAARLAYVVSGHRQLVKRNLEVAYRNTVSHLLKQHDYTGALAYARQSKDQELIAIAGHNGALHFLRNNDFASARRFAGYSLKKTALERTITQHEAVHLYKSGNYHDAIRAYERLGNRQGVKHCYQALYHQEQRKLSGVRTVEGLRAQAGTIRTMQDYARKADDQRLMEHARGLAKQL